MRELYFGGKAIGIRGGIICRLFYYQEFKEEIEKSIGLILRGKYGLIKERLIERGATEKDIDALAAGEVSVYERLGMNVSELEEIIDAGKGIMKAALRVVWAMNKAERFAGGLSTPAYFQWVKEFEGPEGFDIDGVLADLNAEIYEAFHITNSYGGKRGGKAENMSAVSVAVGKKLGFDLRELNEMSVQSFLDIVHAYAGDGKGAGGGSVREAEQEDIDRLLRAGT